MRIQIGCTFATAKAEWVTRYATEKTIDGVYRAMIN